MKSIFWILIFTFPLSINAAEKIRRFVLKTDQIATVRTAIGIATIIQVPDRPNSIVVGDQSAFKVEYLDQAITIKPLRGGARSNLYIYTDYRRFNVQLVTAHESIADYVVYLENPKTKQKSSPISWMKFKNHLKNDGLVFETKRLARTRDGVMLIEFEIRSKKREKLKPEWIWLTQKGITRPIHGLALSGQQLIPGQTVKGIMQVLRPDISDKEPFRIELRRSRISYLTLPKVTTWK
jgi:hypothetical protein